MQVLYNPTFDIFPVLSMAKISVDIEEVDIFRVKQILRPGTLVFSDNEKAFNKILELTGINLVRGTKSKSNLIPYQPSIVVKCCDRVINNDSIFKWFVVKSN